MVRNLIALIYHIIKRKLGSVNTTRILDGTLGGKVFLFPGSIATNTSFEGYNYIHDASVSNSEVGQFTYIGHKTLISNAKIGRFCSIAGDVRIGLGIHPARNFVSMHPSFYSTKNTGIPISFVKTQKFKEGKNIEVGHDVWIGYRAIILDGVKIGDGAAIAAGSVVTKDVPPYAIVGGVPAKVIRYRFSPEQIAKLLDFEWWNKDVSWIKENAEFFESVDVFEEKMH